MDGLEVATLLYEKGFIARGDREKVIEAIDNAAITEAFAERDEDVKAEAEVEAAEEFSEPKFVDAETADD